MRGVRTNHLARPSAGVTARPGPRTTGERSTAGGAACGRIAGARPVVEERPTRDLARADDAVSRRRTALTVVAASLGAALLPVAVTALVADRLPWPATGGDLELAGRQPPVDVGTYGNASILTAYNPAFHQAGAVGRFFNVGANYQF